MTLIEVLIDVAVLGMVAMAILTSYSASFKSMNFAKAKLAAVALANEKMETVRNMPYDSLSTAHGPIYPPGDILDDENLIRNGVELRVHTVISYVDDPYDGNAAGTIAGKPKDLYPYDYKKAEVTVYKKSGGGRLAILTSNVAAKAAETPSNTGIIKICIIDSMSNPVAGASVSITNTTLNPILDMQNLITGDDGCIFVPNLPPDSHHHYHLTVTKAGYSSDQTYAWTAQNPHQIQPDVNVTIQEVEESTLVIDQVSTLSVDLVDQSGAPIGNHVVHIQGAKEIFFQGNKKQKYSQDLTTDANGHISLPNMEFDDYSFSVNGMTIVSVAPFQPAGLKANETLNVKIVASSNAGVMQISGITPSTGLLNQIAYLTVAGKNFGGTSLKMVQGTTEVVATNIVVKSTAVTCEFNFNNAPLGLYDLVIQQGGETVTQNGAFELKSP